MSVTIIDLAGIRRLIRAGAQLIEVLPTQEGLAERDPIEPIIEPGPSTIRPHLTAEELSHRFGGSGIRTLVVTRPDGTLLGLVRRDDIPGS